MEFRPLPRSSQKNNKKKNKQKQEVDQPFWVDALKFIQPGIDVLLRPQRSVTGTITNLTDKDPNTTAFQGFKGGWSGKEKKDSTDIFTNLGWKEKEALTKEEEKAIKEAPLFSKEGLIYKSPLRLFLDNRKNQFDVRDVAEFASDTLLDPLTYVTFGASSALKAGAKGAYKEAAKKGAKTALTSRGQQKAVKDLVQKQYDDTIETLGKQAGDNRKYTTRKVDEGDGFVYDRQVDEGLEMVDGVKVDPKLNPRLVEKLAQKRKTDMQKVVDDAAKAERVKYQNSLLNIDIPFFNTVFQIAKKPKFMKVKDVAISSAQVTALSRIMEQAGATPQQVKLLQSGEATDEQIKDVLSKVGFTPEQKLNLIRAVSGQEDITKLTRQQYEEAVKRAKDVNLRQLDNIGQQQTVKQVEVDGNQGYIDNVANQIKNLMNTKYATEMNNLRQTNPNMTDDEIIQTIIMKQRNLPQQTGNISYLDLPKGTTELIKKYGKNFSRLKSIPPEIRSLMEDITYKLSLMGKSDDIFTQQFVDILRNVSKIKNTKSPAVMLEEIMKSNAKKQEFLESITRINQIVDDELSEFLKNYVKQKPTFKNIIGKLQKDLRDPAVFKKVGYNKDINETILANPKGLDLQELLNPTGQRWWNTKTANVVESTATELARNKNFKNLDLRPFQIDMGGASPLGAALRRKNIFNPRTLFSKDENLNAMGEAMRLTETQMLGRNREMERHLVQFEQMMKDLTPEQREMIPFLLQRAFPDSMLDDAVVKQIQDKSLKIDELKKQLNALVAGKSKSKAVTQQKNTLKEQIATLTKEVSRIRSENKISYDDALAKIAGGDAKLADKIDDVVKKMSYTYKQMAEAEQKAGVLDAVRKDYFPHVINANEEQIKKMKEFYKNDPEMLALITKASGNRFAKERKSFQTLAEVDNKLSTLQTKLNQLDDSTSDEFIRTQKQIEDLSALYERDPIKALANRYYKSIKSISMKELQQTFRNNGYLFSKNQIPEDATDFVRLDYKEAKALGLEEGSYIHQEVLKGLKRVREVFTNEGLENALRTLEVATNAFKTLTTTVLPSHYWYNFIGLNFNNAMAGIGEEAYTKAADLLQARTQGRTTPEQDKLINDMLDKAVLNQTSYGDFLGTSTKSLETKDTISKIDKLITDNPVTRYLRGISDGMDNFYRVAHYIDILEKTNSPKLAAESVRKYLFNYSELTTADRAVKVALPFWNWTKNNIPLQLHSLFTQPRFAQVYLRIKEQSMGDLSDDPTIPEWLKKDYVRFGENAFYNPRVPFQDIGMLGDLNKVAGMQSPFLKVPQEFLLNRQYFNAKPIEYGVDNFKEYDYNLFKRNKDGELELTPLAKYGIGQTGVTSRGLSLYEGLTDQDRQQKEWYKDLQDALIGKTQSIERKPKKRLPTELLK